MPAPSWAELAGAGRQRRQVYLPSMTFAPMPMSSSVAAGRNGEMQVLAISGREVADGQHVALGGPEAGEPPPTAAGSRLRFGRGRGLISRINGGRVIASPS